MTAGISVTGGNHFEIPAGLPDIVAIGAALWGDPTKKTKTEVRFGAHESKIIRPAPVNTWFDHEANTGGGYIDIYKLKYGAFPAGFEFPIPPGMAKELGEPTAWWDYRDASGATIARVVRFDPPGKVKQYRQCRPDGQRWRWKMAGLQIPLYHIPDLLRAPDGATVHITEGEKHADMIRSWGMLATTNAGGAKKFRPYHAAELARFQCVVLPDNDQAGREHAEVVVAALRTAGCQSIRIATLPGLPPKGDVVDWAKAGGTPEAFAAIVADAKAPQDAPGTREPEPAAPQQDEPSPVPDDPGYAASVAADAKAKAKATLAAADLITEDTVALAFADAHKDELRFDHSADKWFHWNGTAWRQEKTKLAYAWARDLARDLAADADNFKAQLSAGKASFASGVERMAKTDRVFAITSDLWNPDPYLLGTPGGTVDLRTGELRPSRQTDHITKQTAVAPAETADCPTWLKFLKETTQGDEQLISFLQRWFGYTLTGDTREHALLFAWGPGGNGKGVLMNTVSGIMAEYATTAAMDTFVTSYGGKHTTDLAMLAGARMVMTTEVDEGQTWAEAKIKALTGEDPITARFMRQDNFTFLPTFKLTVSGNNKPNLNTVDDAIRRRLNLAPFLYKPAKPDKTLRKRLEREWPSILRWLIDGCLEWQQFGLNPPKVVLDATADYFAAQDFYGRWLADCCKIHPTLEEKPGNLLHSFQAWCVENGETFSDNKKLRGMLERTPGVRYGASKGKQIVRGIGLNAAADPRQQPDD